MRIVRLSTVPALVAPNVSAMGRGGGPVQLGLINKFEQVSSDDHKMSIVEWARRSSCPTSGGGEWGWGNGDSARGSPCSENQSVMGNGQMGTPLLNRITDTCENITFQQLRW